MIPWWVACITFAVGGVVGAVIALWLLAVAARVLERRRHEGKKWLN